MAVTFADSAGYRVAAEWVGYLKNNYSTGDAAQRGFNTQKADGEVAIRDNSRDVKQATPWF